MTKKPCFVKTKFVRYKLLFLLLFLSCLSPLSSAKIVDRIIAQINDEIITLSDLYSFKQTVKESEAAQEYTDEKKWLDALIEETLFKQWVKKLKLTAEEEEVTTHINTILKSQGINQAQLLSALKQRGLSYSKYRENIKHGIEQQKLLEREIKSAIVIKNEDIRAYYYNVYKKTAGTKKYRLRQLFFPVEKTDQKSASLKKAQDRAHEAYDQYSKGSSVDTLLKQYDQVESGDLGLVSEDDLLGSFKTALSRLRLKELSPPFETEAGIHLIELLEVKIEGTKSLEKAKDEIRNLLYERDFKKVLAQWIKTKKEQALIKIIPSMTKSL